MGRLAMPLGSPQIHPTLIAVDHILDNLNTRFGTVQSLATINVDDRVYVVAAFVDAGGCGHNEPDQCLGAGSDHLQGQGGDDILRDGMMAADMQSGDVVFI